MFDLQEPKRTDGTPGGGQEPRGRSATPGRIARIAVLATVESVTVGCDQIVKHAAAKRFAASPPISMLGGALRLTYAENPGAFLGAGSNLAAPLRHGIFVYGVSAVLLLVAWGVVAGHLPGRVEQIAAGLAIGGGVGNLIDRILNGVVRDFALIRIGPLSTGIFNVADVAITAGAALILVCALAGRSNRATTSVDPGAV